MSKHLTTSLRTLLIALLIGGGTLLVSAWSVPPASAPDGNTSAPLNEGATTQTKPGVLRVEDEDTNSATVSTDILSVFGISTLSSTVYVGDDELGTPSIDAHVTGKVGVDLDGDDFPSDTPDSELHVHGTARVSSLDSSSNPLIGYPATLCITNAGILVPCEEPGAPLSTSTPSYSVDYKFWNWLVTVVQPTNEAYGDLCTRVYQFNISPSGGTPPYSTQWQTKRTAIGTWVNHISTLTMPWGSIGDTDVGTWYIRAIVTDSEGNSVTSTQTTFTAEGVAGPDNGEKLPYMNCI